MHKKLLSSLIIFLFSADIFADNYSLSFDYMDGYAVSSLTSDEIFGDNYTFTVESWYKNDGVDSGNNQGYDDGANIVSNYKRSGGGDPYNNFTLSMVPENYGDIGTFNMQGAGSVERYDDGQWHHVVGIIEKTSENSATSILYVDGEFISQNELGESDFISSYNKIYINNHSPFAGDYMQDCSVAGIRVSSGKRYSENFSPEFPLSTDGETIFNLDFSSGDGSTLDDLSSNGHNFAIQGNATWSGDVPVPGCTDPYADNYNSNANVDDGSCAGYPDNGDYSLSFDGVDDYVLINSSTSLSSPNNLSIIARVNIENTGPIRCIISKGNDNASDSPMDYTISADFTGTINLINAENSGWYQLEGVTGINNNTWYNIAMTYNGDILKSYLNGNFENSSEFQYGGGNPINTNMGDINQTNNPLKLGAYNLLCNGCGYYFQGIMDEIIIYNAEISAENLNLNYNNGLVPNQNDIIAHYKFNTGSGNILYDHSGNANHGTINGATWSMNVPVPGCTDPLASNYDPNANSDDGSCLYDGDYSLSFDGVDDYVTVPYSSALNSFTDAMTVSAWVKTSGQSNIRTIIENGNTQGFALLLDAEGFYGNVQNEHPTNPWTTVEGSTVIELNTWYHVAMTYTPGYLLLYVNGVLDGTAPESVIGNIVNNDSEMYIGRYHDYDNYFPGNMDEVSIWNTTLTPEEIQSYMSTPPTGSESGLVGYWNFNEGTGSTLTDQTSNGNDGTINGTTWSTDVPVPGCTDPLASNYDPNANSNDGSCLYDGDYSLSFDGVDDYVNVANSEHLNFSSGQSYTIQLDFKSNFSGTLSSGQCLLAKAYDDIESGIHTTGWQIFITPEEGNPLLFNANQGYQNGGSYLYGPTSSEYNDDDWHNVTVVYNHVLDQAYFYFDGVLNSSFSNHGSMDLSNDSDFKFGTDRNNSGFFSGLIDKVSIWDSSLTPSQIQSYITNPPSGSESDLLGYWNFNEGTGTILTDQTSNGNDGTIVGATWSDDVPTPPAPENFSYAGSFEGNTYYYSSELRSWSDNKILCENAGGHLVTINNADENSFVQQMVSNHELSGGGGAHIGFTDEAEEGNWQWVMGVEVNYTNWGDSEPNNSWGGEHYGQMYSTGFWNDCRNNSGPDAFIAIMETEGSTPPPSAGNHSLSFDGEDYVSLSNSPMFSGVQNNFTISAWINPELFDGWGAVFHHRGHYNDIYLNVTSEGQIRFYVGGSTALFGDLELNQWVHISGTYDGTTAKLFINGDLVDSQNDFNGDVNWDSNYCWETFGGSSENSTDLCSGGYSGLIGKMDDVSIWNQALTQGQIQANIISEILGSEEGLVGYWNFNEGEGNTLTDLSGNGNHGAIHGASWSTDVPLPPMVSSVQITGTSGFRILSSPVSGNIYSDLLDELWTQGMAGSDDPNNGGANVWAWSSGSWQALTDLDNDTYTAGAGILVYVFADADFNGVEDDLPVTLTIDGTQNTSPVTIATNEDSWNLLGNPYGWSLDISDLMGGNSEFDPNIYIWDNATSAYRTHNEQAGDIADGLLAPFQGFWVEAKTNGNNFAFTEASVSTGQGTNYRTTVNSTGSALIAFTSAEHTSSVYLSFTLDGQVNDDPADAYRLMPLDHKSHLTSMFYVSNDAVSIKNLPYDFNADIGLDLDVMMLAPSEEGFETVSEDITMTWDFAEMPEGISMILMDNATSEFINMNETDHYDLTVEPKGGFETNLNQVLTYPVVGQNRFSIFMSGATAAVQNFIPEEFAMHPAYPNPFNPTTTINYDVNQTGHIQLKVYDMMGREVAELVNEVVLAGRHRLNWNTPGNMASGVYLVQINNGQKVFNQRITLLK